MFYLLAMQWIPFWESDWTLSMGIFITEGGGNWGWRETVGKADKHHQFNSFDSLAKLENTCIHNVPTTNPLYIQSKRGATNPLGLTEGQSQLACCPKQDRTLPGTLLIRTVSTVTVTNLSGVNLTL